MDIEQKNTHSEQHESLSFGSLKIVAILFIFLVLVTAGLLFYKSRIVSKPQIKTIVVNKQFLQKRSKDLGIIVRGLTGKAIDVNTGKIVKAARIFSPNDKTVYLQLDLNNAPKGTVIDVIRYKDGRYVSHDEITIPQANTKNVLFKWTITLLLGNTREGKWKAATYNQGVLAKRILYEVHNNVISYVYPDEQVKQSDSDYKLTYVLAANKRNH